MQRGSTAERAAERLLHNPDRLLSAILFWNLLVNTAYFTLASICALHLERAPEWGNTWAVVFSIVALLLMIFFGELLPKSIGVMISRRFAQAVAIPLSVAVRILDPLMPVLQTINLVSRRILLPNFQRESYLEIKDLERAIHLSVADADLQRQEQTVLNNIVLLSDIRVDEWMRPRTQFQSFRPPVHLSDVQGKELRMGYLLITEYKQDEISRSIRLASANELPDRNLDRMAVPVLYLPWCTTVAHSLQQMNRLERDVAVIVNEHGETIGILTIEDIFDTILSYAPSRSKRLLDENPIHYIRPNCWVVSGMVGLRQLSRRLEIELPKTKSITIAGVIQEKLQRLAQPGDVCRWGPFELRVLEYPYRGHMLVEITRPVHSVEEA
jgi:CBS domain containing-hemolysin-like protein